MRVKIDRSRERGEGGERDQFVHIQCDYLIQSYFHSVYFYAIIKCCLTSIPICFKEIKKCVLNLPPVNVGVEQLEVKISLYVYNTCISFLRTFKPPSNIIHYVITCTSFRSVCAIFIQVAILILFTGTLLNNELLQFEVITSCITYTL